MFILSGMKAIALNDSRFTQYIFSQSFVRKLGIIPDRSGIQFEINLHSKQEIKTDRVVWACLIQVHDQELCADLILLMMNEFDVILGVDWPFKYRDTLHYGRKIINFAPTGTKSFIMGSTCKYSSFPIIFSMKSQKMIQKGCIDVFHL